jgi:hypothetical protein
MRSANELTQCDKNSSRCSAVARTGGVHSISGGEGLAPDPGESILVHVILH